MTRTLVLTALLTTAACAAAQESAPHEALPWGDLEYMSDRARGAAAWTVWPRVGEPGEAEGWTVQRDDAAGGEVCVAGTIPQSEFALGGEGEWAGEPIFGSVRLRSDEPTQATVRLTWYDRFKPVSETVTVDVGTDWSEHALSTTPDRGGPFELAVAPVADLPVYADDFSIRCAAPPHNEQVEDPTPVPDEPIDLSPLQTYEGNAQGRSGEVSLTLTTPGGAEPLLPCAWGGVPFPKGELYRREQVQVTDVEGAPVEAQFDVLARWHGDASILGLLVTVPADAPNDLRLIYGPEVDSAAAAPPADATFSPRIHALAVALDGTEYPGPGKDGSMGFEREGPLARVFALRIPVGPLTIETRVTGFADSSRAIVSTTFINEGPAVPLKGLGVRIPREGGAPAIVMTGDGSAPLRGAGEISWGIGPNRTDPALYGVSEDTTLTGAVAVPSGESGIGVAMRDFAENRPSGFTCTPEALTAWAWPPEAGGFVMSQGMARTMDLIVDMDADSAPRPFRTEEMPLLTADAEWICDTGVFNFLMTPDPETFPIFESTLGSLETLGRFSPERKVSGDLYGLFNYGDAPGDGGWSNLETMADHEIFLHFFRTMSRPHFDAARLAAEHYRDVDIDHRFGYCHTHCSQHTWSGESWSHSWIQGVRDLYLLTGDTRSRAVLREVGERLLSKQPGFTTGRDWTRPIDNLVDIYQVTGDERYLDAVMAHIRVLGERQIPEQAVCGAENGSWYHNRYAAGSAFTWYGCLAMAKLHQNVGGETLREIFLRELDLSLDVETKGKASYVYYPDEEISEDKRAQVIGRYALGRGSVLFPALGYAYELTGDEGYLKLGMDVLAHNLLNQRGSSDASATSFITVFLRVAKQAGYGAAEEREAFERAREFSWAQYPRDLTNGGFEDGFVHWSVKNVPENDFQAYEDEVVNVGYYVDEEAVEGEKSLRIHSDNRLRRITVTSKAALPAGHRWRLTGWVKADETMTPGMSYSLRSYDDDSRGSGMLRPTGEQRDGWIQHGATFTSTARQVLTVQLVNQRGTGDVRFDGFALEDLGEVGRLLTENGVGHEGREPSPAMVIRTGGSYLPDEPMTGDIEMEGPIPFTKGSLTDGDDSYDYHRTPSSYAYWKNRDSGEILFDLGDSYAIGRVALKVNVDRGRHAHGTSRIELLPAEGDEPLAVIDAVEDGWNEFAELDIEAQKLRLRLHRMEGRTYVTIAEVQIWGNEPR
jgi:hypothetical protein